jgi:hypothetical protein
MQARIVKNFARIESLHPEVYREFALGKIIRDVDILYGESENILSIFRSFENKILAFSACGQEMINISQLLESELKFADFYLDFKHHVNKAITAKDNVPEVFGDRAGYCLCVSALINSARQRMRDAPEKELSVSVDYDDAEVSIVFQDSGEKIVSSCYNVDGAGAAPDIEALPVSEHCLCYALMLLARYGFQTDVDARNGRNIISLRIPYRQTFMVND